MNRTKMVVGRNRRQGGTGEKDIKANMLQMRTKMKKKKTVRRMKTNENKSEAKQNMREISNDHTAINGIRGHFAQGTRHSALREA